MKAFSLPPLAAALFVLAMLSARSHAQTRPTAPVLREVGRLEGKTGGFLLFSPDGSRIVAADGSTTISDSTHHLQFWDAKTFQPIGDAIEHPHLRRAEFDTSGRLLLTVACLESPAPKWQVQEGDARLWDVPTRKLLRQFSHGTKPLSGAELSPDGSLVATWSHDDVTVRLCDAASGKLLAELPHPHDVGTARFAHGGSILATKDGVDVRLWDARTGTLRTTLADLSDTGPSWTPPAISADGKRIAVAGTYTIGVYDAQTGRRIQRLDTPLGLDTAISDVALSSDGALAAASSTELTDKQGMVFEVATGKLLFTVRGADSGSPAFSPNGRLVLFNVYKGPALFDVRSGAPVALPDDVDPDVGAFSPDGRILATGSAGPYAQVLAVEAPAALRPADRR
jgi:WD40 repeat protein